MRSETYKIKDLIKEISMGPFGSNIKVECFVDSGVPVLNGSNLTGYAVNDDKLRFVTDEKADSLGKANACRGDVIVTHRGTLGQIAFIPPDSKYKRYVISQSQFRVCCNEKILPEYMVYYFHTKKGQHKLLSNASQVGVPALARATTTFQSLEIEVPAIEEQKKIIEFFEIIRKKIELNVTINQNLEQQAQALFKSWFLDFDPFGGKAPIDWMSATLGEVASIKTETFSPTKNPDVIVEHYSIPAYDEKHYPIFEPAAGIKSNKYILTSMSVMISKLNPETKRIWRPLCISDMAVSSTEFIVYEAHNPSYKDYIYSVIDSMPFFHYLCASTTGSTNSRQRATPKATLDFPLLLPTKTVISEFCSMVSPMYDLIGENLMENQSLVQIRDNILPRLMSGELDVSSINI